MLRDAGVRTKLLAVLTIPTVLLVVVTSLLVGGQFSAARRAGQVNALTDVAIQVNRVVHSLQEERSATLRYLQAPDSGSRAAMKGQRQFTNQQLRTLRGLVADSPVQDMNETIGAAVLRSTAGHQELGSARASVDASRFFATEADVFYTKVIRTDLDLPGVIASSGTTELAQRLQAYAAISTAIEYSAHERDLVEVALLRGSLTESDFAQSAALVAQTRQALQDFQRNAPAAAFSHLDNALAGSEVSAIDQVRRDLPDLLKGKDPNYGRSVEWVGAANSRIGPMTDAESGLVSDISLLAEQTQNSQERRAFVLVLGALIGLGLAAMLAIGLARRITRPLRRLTVAAGEIGAELPHMVERMQTPGEGPGVVVEPIPVESSDEIGKLAEAFNTVNDVTVQVAKEQAALRSSIAEMFVNVARRNQVLLGRQLSQLDTMEAREEDPDVLDSLFKLDHLATRMRRNAESLLVLAGIDSTRRLRRALPLSDVIRTAVGEIENFDRIDLSMSEDPDVSGRHALSVAHLLAELLENATHFSNPDTRVVVSASMTGHGVDVTVTDYGLGMSEEEIVDANDKIAHPPIAEIAVSQRLGLFVVGRLAARLGASVTLRRGRAAGTVVALTLPAAVFEGMVIAEPVVDEVVAVDATAVEPVEQVVADDVEVVAVAEDAEVAEVEPSPEPAPPAAPRGLLRRGRRRAPASQPVEPEPVAEVEVVEFEVVQAEPLLVEELLEPEPAVAEVAPQPEPEPVVAEVAPEPEPEPEPVLAEVAPEPEPEPAPEPVVPIVYAPAVDVLPSRTQRSGSRFGRHRQPAPAPQPAPYLPVAFVPAPAPRPTPVAEVVAPVEPVPPVEPAAPVEPVAAPLPVAADLPSAPPEQATAPAVPLTPMPRRPAAPAPLPAHVGVAVGSSAAPASGSASSTEPDPMTAQSDLQSSALSELRGLYAPFTPEVAPPVAAPTGGLARRTPKAATDDTTPASAPAQPARSRSAAEVRGMLSGFRAGVERGRGGDASADHIDDTPTS